jgi:hypothetical protein
VRATDTLNLYRFSDAGTYIWTCHLGGLVNGTWYDLQISWGASTTTPIVKLNNVSKTMTLTQKPTIAGYPWSTDFDAGPVVMNSNSMTGAARGQIAIFRLHDTNLSSAYLSDNYAVDWGRVYQTIAWSQTTVPGVAIQAYAPTCVALDQTPQWIERSSPDVAITAFPPTAAIVTNELPVAGNVTIAAHAPTCVSARYPDVPSPPEIKLTWKVRDNFVVTTVVEETQNE